MTADERRSIEAHHAATRAYLGFPEPVAVLSAQDLRELERRPSVLEPVTPGRQRIGLAS